VQQWEKDILTKKVYTNHQLEEREFKGGLSRKIRKLFLFFVLYIEFIIWTSQIHVIFHKKNNIDNFIKSQK